MSIKQKTKLGGMAIVGALAVSIVAGSWSINTIRVGGPVFERDKLYGDFVSDIIPPPIFVIQPWLEASLLANQHGSTEAHLAKMDQLHRAYEANKSHWDGLDLPQDVKARKAAADADAEQFWSIYYDEFVPALRSNDRARVVTARDRLGVAFQKHEGHINDLIGSVSASRKAEIEASHATMVWAMVLLSLLATLIVAMVSASVWYALKKVLAPVEDTAATMHRMAGGDLEAGRTTTHRDDEIGDMTRAIEVFRETSIGQRDAQQKQRLVVDQLSGALTQLAQGNLAHRMSEPLAPEYEELRVSFNRATEQLGALLQDVARVASSVATGAGEIRAASNDLALRNEQQAASLEETVAAMNQVTGIVRETARGASDAQGSIGEAHREATEGGVVVDRAVAAMAAIEKSAQEITQIINVIDGIAFQTNLLALNAGVEAARAGDAGKGFAVVANEVRALAQRSADAAKDIKELITVSTQQVAGGVKLVGETGTLLAKIVGQVGEINTLVSGIAAAAESQAVSLGQVNGSVGEMDRMTQQNAAMVEQSTAASRSLADEASELNRLVSRFSTGGAAVPAAPAANPPRRATPRPAPARVAAVRAPAPVAGNLAVAAPDGDDWSEF